MMNALCEAVQAALASVGLWRENARLLCALSGGADSVALLHALCRLQSQAGFDLRAIHVQHGLRAENSDADERFARDLCRQLAVPLTVERADLTGSMEDAGMETLARQERRRIFAACMEEQRADALLTAHHRDDQAETVLMHLLRGSGMKGLCGMQPCVPFSGGVLLRPFLALSKAQLAEALASEGLPHREDESNQLPLTPRNALRLEILPELERLYPGAGKHIAAVAATLQAEEDFLQAEANRLFERSFYRSASICALSKVPLQHAPDALVRRVVRLSALAAGLPTNESLSLEDTLALAALLHAPSGAAHNLPGGLIAVSEAHYLHFTHGEHQPAAFSPIPLLSGNAQYRFPHAVIRQQAADGSIPASPHTAVLTPDVLAMKPVLRLMQPGDVIHPLGAPGSKPLRRFFTDRRIDRFFRCEWPVLCAESTVLWVPALCASEALRIADVPCGSIQLTCQSLVPHDPHQPKE